jgi:hypothetical protein
MAAQAIDSIQKTVEAKQEADDRLAVSLARSQFLIDRNKALAEVDDGDYKTYQQRYDARLKQARERAVGSVESPYDRQFLEADLAELETAGQLEVQSRIEVRKKDERRASVTQRVYDLTSEVMTAADPNSVILEMDSIIQDAATTGLISQEDAVTMRQKSAVNAIIGRVEAIADPNERMKFIESGNEALKRLPPDTMSALRAKTSSEIIALENHQYMMEQRANTERYRRIYNLVTTPGEDGVGPGMSAVPTSEFALLTPEQQENIRKVAEGARHPKYSDPETIGQLETLWKESTPASRRTLAATTLNPVKLSQRDHDKWTDRIQQIQEDRVGEEQYITDATAGSKFVVPMYDALGITNPSSLKGQEKLDEQKKVGLVTLMLDDRIDQYKRDNQVEHVPTEEFKQMVAKTAADLHVRGLTRGSTGGFSIYGWQIGGTEDPGYRILPSTEEETIEASAGFEKLASAVGGDPALWKSKIVERLASVEKDKGNADYIPNEGAITNYMADTIAIMPEAIQWLQENGEPVTEETILQRVDEARRAMHRSAIEAAVNRRPGR